MRFFDRRTATKGEEKVRYSPALFISAANEKLQLAEGDNKKNLKAAARALQRGSSGCSSPRRLLPPFAALRHNQPTKRKTNEQVPAEKHAFFAARFNAPRFARKMEKAREKKRKKTRTEKRKAVVFLKFNLESTRKFLRL